MYTSPGEPGSHPGLASDSHIFTVLRGSEKPFKYRMPPASFRLNELQTDS